MHKAIFILLFFSITLAEAQPKEITLEDIWYNGTFSPERVPGFNFLQDGRHYTRLIDNQIVKFDLTTGSQVDVILSGGSISDDFKISSYGFSKDERTIVVRGKAKKIFRRSYTAQYVAYQLDQQKTIPIADMKMVSYATLNPQADRVAYVKDNNLFVQSLKDGKITQVTKDGEKNKIINGSTDWVYEEEFGFVKAFFWSPEGNYISYIRFDEREVQEFTMTLHRDQNYPKYNTFKYPKVGEKNSVVSAHIYSLNDGKTISADIGDLDDQYIPRMHWSANEKGVCVYKMNRHQNNLKIFYVNPKDGSSKVMLEETNKYYIDIHDNLTFVDNGKCFLWTSEMDGYNHIYLYGLNGKKKRQITNGKWEVTSFYGYDEKRDKIYYQSTEPGSMDRAIYRVDLKGKKKEIVAGKSGTNSAQFGATFDYYVLQHSDYQTPPTYVVYNQDQRVIRPLVNNAGLKGKMSEYGALDVKLESITTEEGVELNAAFIKPANFDPKKKYPLFMYQYGGPGSQQVKNSWNSFRYYWFFQYLAHNGYAVAVVDNRGTGGKGEEFKKLTYMQMGKFETIDQINAAKYYGKRDYIDQDRIGIFGWSYGGYMASLCVLKGNDVFKAGIAVAPVTNWKWYDSIYTERYMRTTIENPDGYKDNSPVYFADRLKGNYLLVHGMADDNVHFQNTAEMANALIKANKQFDTYFYPNKNHGIYGGYTRLHLFQKISNFVFEKI